MLGGREGKSGGSSTRRRPPAGADPPNEMGVLLCCARTRMDAASAARLRGLLQAGVDWDSLVGAAFKHGLLPLLYLNLKSCDPGLVPAHVAAHLRELFLSNARRNLFLADELAKLLCFFQANGVDALPFKGPALAELVYGDLALRPFADLKAGSDDGHALAATGHLDDAGAFDLARGGRA